MKDIQCEVIDDKFAVVHFDQANSPVNLFNPETLSELDQSLREIEQNPNIEGVVFVSDKRNVFHAGADLHGLEHMNQIDLRHFLEQGQEVFHHVAMLKVPTAAAINGACVGGGCELALACDYRVATDDHSTKIGLPETRLGILPAWGGSTRLPRLIGVAKALRVILAGQTPGGKQALRLGMVDAIAPREQLLAAALKLVKKGRPHHSMWKDLMNRVVSRLIAPSVHKRLMSQTRGLYPARLKAEEIVLASVRSSEEQSLARERKALFELAETDTCRNLIRLFFQGERARKSEGARVAAIERAAVIGAGVMGSGIAEWMASRGIRVILRDIDPQFVAKGMGRIQKLFGNRRVFTEKEGRDGMDRISPAVGDCPLDQVDLVIEAAVEKMAAKKKIFTSLDQHASRPDTILATNTSALSLVEIAGSTKDPSRVIGIHFFNPVHKMQLVEVVASPLAAPETIHRAVEFVRQIKKLPVVVKDSPGFLVNRVLMPYLLEAGLLFEAGASTADIDEAMLDFGMPMGPLRLIDEVGTDIATDVAATLVSHFSDRLRLPPELKEMVAQGWLGEKSGKGFYVYSGKKAVPHEAVKSLRRSKDAAKLDRSEIQMRLSLLLANESARCLEEKIVEDAATVDFAIVMGTGFAPFRGGPLRFVDEFGLRRAVDKLERLSVESGPHFTPSTLLKQLAAEGRHFHED